MTATERYQIVASGRKSSMAPNCHIGNRQTLPCQFSNGQMVYDPARESSEWAQSQMDYLAPASWGGGDGMMNDTCFICGRKPSRMVWASHANCSGCVLRLCIPCSKIVRQRRDKVAV